MLVQSSVWLHMIVNGKCVISQISLHFSHEAAICTAVTLTGPVDDYNQGVELYGVGALVPEVEGIDFPEILGPKMCGQDVGRNLGNWVSNHRNSVERHCMPLCIEVHWQNCS